MWAIDYRSVKEKTVQDLVTSLKIQVDNLCQMLPQNRVQDFCQMNPQELLKRTLATIGDQEAIGQMNNLVNYRTEQRQLDNKMQTNTKLIEEQMTLHETLKKKIEAMRHRNEYEKKISICEKKKLWLQYKLLSARAAQTETRMAEALKIVKASHKKKQPLEMAVQSLREEKIKLEQERATGSRKINELADKVKELLNGIQDYDRQIKEVDRAFEEKLQRHRNRERELVEARTKLDKLKNDRTSLIEKFGDEKIANERARALRERISEIQSQIHSIQRSKARKEMEYEQQTLPNLRILKNKLRKLEDVETKRLETLKEYSEDTYKALEWLNENKDLFHDQVYGPMMLELKFTHPETARYLESTVSSKDLVAFTFQSSRDMNLFLQRVREELQLRAVSALCSRAGDFSAPHHDIRELSYLGFQRTLVEGIAAPGPVLRYLCEQYQVHRIPIGNDHTYHHSENVPDHVTLFFTTRHRFSVRVSQYSGARASTVGEVRPPRLLANARDADLIRTCALQLKTLNATSESQLAAIKSLGDHISELEQRQGQLNNELKVIKDNASKIAEISCQIRVQARKVEGIENEESFDVAAESSRAAALRARAAAAQRHLHAGGAGALRRLHAAAAAPALLKVKLEIIRDEIVKRESELIDLRTELDEAKRSLDLVQTQHAEAQSRAAAKLSQVRARCGGADPADPASPLAALFRDLPDELDALAERCYELQTSVDCMDKETGNVIKDYEDCEKAIEALQAENKSVDRQNQTLLRRMDTLSTQWLPTVEKLLQEIDKRFGEMFALLNCAGEVRLDKGNSDEDYDKYGVVVLVRFRESEELQPLCRKRHSGGERALSIALYLMALQRLFTVPFRCVDEINQGMDEINERKMFQLLVQVTSECENSQYFLLTPKLLSNLEYNDKIMVHTIMNGKHVMKYKEWNHATFVQRARQLSRS